MEIKKIDIQKVITCGLEEDVKDIAKKLKENKERRIFVVDEDEKLKGIITTTDLVYKGICDDCGKAKDVMVSDVKSVDINEDLDKALEIMNELKSFVCPVTEEGKLVGVISYHDLVGYVLSSAEK